jgi:hypothetical protein
MRQRCQQGQQYHVILALLQQVLQVTPTISAYENFLSGLSSRACTTVLNTYCTPAICKANNNSSWPHRWLMQQRCIGTIKAAYCSILLQCTASPSHCTCKVVRLQPPTLHHHQPSHVMLCLVTAGGLLCLDGQLRQNGSLCIGWLAVERHLNVLACAPVVLLKCFEPA